MKLLYIPSSVILDTQIPYGPRVLYGILLSVADRKGFVDATQAWIAEKMGVDQPHISRALRILEQGGHISISGSQCQRRYKLLSGGYRRRK